MKQAEGRGRAGVVLAVLCLATALAARLAPPAEGLTVQGQTAIGVFAAVFVLWVFRPMPAAASSLAGAVGLILLGAVDTERALPLFASPAVLFFLGATVLAAAAQGTGLLRRVFLAAALHYGTTPSGFGRALFLAASCLSLFLPAEAVAVALFPVAAAASDGLALRPRQGRTAVHLFGCAAWGTAAGSMATPAGAAQAALAMGLLGFSAAGAPTFSAWTAALLPPALVAGALGLILLRKFHPPDGGDLEAASAHLESEWKKAGPMSRSELGVGVVIAAAAASWLSVGRLPWLAAASLGVTAALAALRLRSWPQILTDAGWSVVPFLGGALILGDALGSTGASRWLAEGLFSVLPQTQAALLIFLCPASFLLALRMGGASSLAALLPVSLAAAPAVGTHPETAAFAAATAAGAALAVSPAGVPGMIAGATGYFRRRSLLLPGLILLAAVTLLSLAAAAFYWPLFAAPLSG